MKSRLLNYFLLTKPRILLLVLLTGVTALIVEGSFPTTPGSFLLVLLGLFLASGSANAFNQYFEREVDALMSRTAGRRPLPLGRIVPRNALVFALILGAGSTLIFAVFFNLLSSLLALATVLFYGFFYTLILKPRTSLNIVIGGAAGAMTPVIAWAAASGTISLVSMLMAALIFIWTPPHFWSLAIIFRKDYEKVSYPMTPNIIGIPATYRKMIYYSLLLILTGLLLSWTMEGHNVFLVACSIISGAVSLLLIGNAIRKKELADLYPRRIFLYSLVHLTLLFTSIIIDVTA